MVKAAFLPLMSIVLLLLVISERPAGAYRSRNRQLCFQVIAGAILGGVFPAHVPDPCRDHGAVAGVA